MDDIRERVISLLIGEFTKDDTNTQHLRELIQLSSSYQSFRSQNGSHTSEVISCVNRCMNTSKARLEGLLLLHHVLDQCNTTVYLEHAMSWTKMLLQILQSYNERVVYEMAATVLSSILCHAVTFSELSRDIATSLIPQLIPTLLADNTEWECAAFDCLKSCLSCFPGSCGPFKHKIADRLLSGMVRVSTSSDQLSVLSQCYSLVAVCGGGGFKGSKITEGWSLATDKLMGSLHETLDMLYLNLETDGYSRPELSLNIPSPPEVDPERTYTLLHHYTVLCHTLADMLRPRGTFTAPVPVEDILNIICRASAISPKFLMTRPTHQRVLLCSVLPTIHQMSLLVLENLITCIEGGLITHSGVINKLLIQTLSSVSGISTEIEGNSHKPFCELKQTVYRVANTWMIIMGANSAMATVANDFINHVLIDAKPHHDTVKTGISRALASADHVWGKRKKNKKGAQNRSDTQSLWQQKTNVMANWQLCAASLKALRQLIMCSGTLLSPQEHKMIQEFIIPLSLNVCQYSDLPPASYQHPECRKALYGVLLACVLVPSTRWPSPIQLALTIFSNARTSETHLETKSYCQEALLVSQSLIHPRIPPLVAPQSIEEIIQIHKSMAATNTEKPRELGIHMSDLTESAAGGNKGEEGEEIIAMGRIVKPIDQQQEHVVSMDVEQEVEKNLEEKSSVVEESFKLHKSSSSYVGHGNGIVLDEDGPENASASRTIDNQVGSPVTDNSEASFSASDHVSTEALLVNEPLEKPQQDCSNRIGLKAVDNTELASCGVKRKHCVDDVDTPADTDQPDAKRQADATDLMLQSFIDEGPDIE